MEPRSSKSTPLSAGESAALQFLLAQSWCSFLPRTRPPPRLGPTFTRLRRLRWLPMWHWGREPCQWQLDRSGEIGEPCSSERAANGAALEILAATRGDGDDDLTGECNEETSGHAVWQPIPHAKDCKPQSGFTASQRRSADANAAQQRLDGCAPESTDYAQSLAEQGRHSQAAQSLRALADGCAVEPGCAFDVGARAANGGRRCWRATRRCRMAACCS